MDNFNLSENEADVIKKFKVSMDQINDSFRVKQSFFIDNINQLSYKEKFFQVAEEHTEIHDFKDQKIVEYEEKNNGDTEKAVLELIKDFKKTL